MSGTPAPGARCEPGGVRFRVWAPDHDRVEVILEDRGVALNMTRGPDGVFEGLVPGLGAGARYRYRLDGGEPLPDPASRFQPEGVHGPSEVVDPSTFRWTDGAWPGPDPAALVIYELHTGTFTPEGTFAAAAARLPHLRELGINTVELMPVADFAGRHNWGYDGVALYAPARCYGRPDDLRRFVDRAHALGIAVLLDVVYNHLGPDGAYHRRFAAAYTSRRHHTAWGDAFNLDEPGSGPVRAYLTANAAHWIREYRFDGLRLDATHAIHDDSPRHILEDLARAARDAGGGRRVVVIAEDVRNLAVQVRPAEDGGLGLDGVWADDFHHQVRRILAGDADGYYRDFTGSPADLAETLRRGWLFTGQHSIHYGGPRGTDPAGVPPHRFVLYLQNHDQTGNRALGERLHHQVDPAAWRAAVLLLLAAPGTPLLFMGQEWSAGSPFLYFTDHHADLGRQVTEGRRRDFAAFTAFADPEARRRIPDPQDPATFRRSRLDWAELATEPHAAVFRLHRDLLRWRAATRPVTGPDGLPEVTAVASGLWLARRGPAGRMLAGVRLVGAGRVPVPSGGRWRIVFDTESCSGDPAPARIDASGDPAGLVFARPGGVILQEDG